MADHYGFGKRVEYDFDTAIQKTIEELKKEEFGIISDIDVAATLKTKLEISIPPYRILGACNPTFAHAALEIDPSIGLLLPCNVVVRQDNNNKIYIEFMDPNSVLGIINNPEIDKIANEVKNRLRQVMKSL